jgi:hypothetical protein
MKSYKFNKEFTGRWYIDLPEWPGAHADLEMVSGADTMLEILGAGENEVRLVISTNYFENSSELTLKKLTPEIGGGIYLMKQHRGIEYNLEMWLCEVTRFVFDGEMPEKIYIAESI